MTNKLTPVRELKKGDKLRCIIVSDGRDDTMEDLEYGGMDGMYAKFYDKEGNIMNLGGSVQWDEENKIYIIPPPRMDNLQDLLNKLTDKGRLAFGLYKDAQFILDEYSLNDLCSISSGLWQFVCENGYYGRNLGYIELVSQIRIQGELYSTGKSDGKVRYRECQYRLMLSSIQEDKEKFLLDNILIND